jgi:hypothetical protein
MSTTTQLVDYQLVKGKDGRWHVEMCAKLLRQAADKPTQRKFAMWLRTEKINDRALLQFLLKLLDIQVGKKVELGEFGEELLQELGGAAPGGMPAPGALGPLENEPFLRLVFDRFVELNGYLVQFVFNEMADGFLALHEVYRRIGMSGFLAERPSMTAFEAWFEWMVFIGIMKTVGFRKQLTERGLECWEQLKDVPLEELLGGGGALGVLAGLSGDDDADEEAPADEPSYIVAADLPENANTPVAASPGGAATTVAGAIAGDEGFDEDMPDFGPQGGAPPADDVKLPGLVPDARREDDESRPLSEDEREAIRDLFGDDAIEELEGQDEDAGEASAAPEVAADGPESAPAGGNGAGAAAAAADAELQESIGAVSAAADALIAGLATPPPDSEADAQPTPPAAEVPPPAAPDAAPAEPAKAPPPRPAATTAAPARAPAPVSVTPAARAPGATAAQSLTPAERHADRVRAVASMWEVQEGRRPIQAKDVGVERADEAWGYTLFQLCLAAVLMEGERPAPEGLPLFRTLTEVGALRQLYTGKLRIDDIIEPPADSEIGQNPHGRAIERLAYVPWLRRACRDQSTLTRLAGDPDGRAARLRAACGGALGPGVYWVEREMQRLGVWR